MTSRSVLSSLALAAVAACGGHGGGAGTGPVAVAQSSSGAVREFLAGVADSNLNRIGASWGTDKGPAAATNVPADWRQRAEVMQLWLRGRTYKITGDQQLGNDRDHRQVTVDLTTGNCTKTVPFVTVRTSHGWLVEQVDLNTAGNPAQPCGPPAAPAAAPTGR